MKIVIVEDQPTLQKSIAKVLKDEGHVVSCFADGDEALAFLLVEKDAVDLLILDRMLPGKDGLAIAKILRSEGNAVPVLMLTAKDTVTDKVAGLEGGADYYLTKPFEFEELLACITALRRRPRKYQQAVVELLPGLSVDLNMHLIARNGKEIALTPTEFGILEYLVRNKGRAVSQPELYDHVFDFAKEHWSNAIEVHVKNLRKKLSVRGYENPIKTIRGAGYTLTA